MNGAGRDDGVVIGGAVGGAFARFFAMVFGAREASRLAMLVAGS